MIYKLKPHSMVSSLIIISVVLVYTVFGQDKLWAELNHDELFDGKTCLAPEISIQANSVVECTVMCKSVGSCSSIFYKEANGHCIGCKKTYLSPDVSELKVDYGTKYFDSEGQVVSECSIEKPCSVSGSVCHSGMNKCVCPFPWLYSPSQKICVDSCALHGVTYQLFEATYVDGYNLYWETNRPNPNRCLKDCALNPACYGVDHKLNERICFFTDTPAADSVDGWMEGDPNYNLYVKNCH